MTARFALAAPFLFLAACGAPTPNEAAPAENASDDRPTDFSFMDDDGDGLLTADEHAASAQAMFATMDGDGDGFVTAAEMDSAQAELGGSKAMASADKIKAVDSDGDGRLSATEHQAGSARMFATMDTDKNGALSRAEFDAGHKAMLKS